MTNIEREYTIEVPGVPSELQSRMKDDIKVLLKVIAAVADAWGTKFLLNSIRVTNCLEDDVNQLLSKRSGSVGYVAARNNVHVIGKTLWVRSEQGDIRFTVVIDAKQIGAWGIKEPLCLTTILHELVHVLYEERHLNRLGEEEYTADLDTKERWLNNWATLLLDEFDVDRQVDKIVGMLAGKDDGQPWSLRELDEVQGIDWVQGLLDSLNQTPRYVDEQIYRFQTGQIGIDDLATTVITQVKDLFRLLSHTASRYMETELWPDIMQQIKATDASQRFFREYLGNILDRLDDEQASFAESVQVVAHAVAEIFHNCGLGFKTVPEGVYISVAAPSR